MADDVCLNAVRGISDLVIAPGLINVDFADVRTIMTGMGRALMGTGYGTGDKRAIEAAQQAISSPLLEDVSINGATGILLNITGGPDLTLAEVNEACSLIAEAADPEANIIFGSVIDAHVGDEVRITVIATGFNQHAQEHPAQGAGRGHGRGHARGRENQMALPMQASSAMAQAPTMMVQQPPHGSVGTDVDTRRRAAATRRRRSARATAARRSTSTSSTRAWQEVPPAAMGAVPQPAPERAEWTPSERRNVPERPEGPAPQAANTAPAPRCPAAGRRRCSRRVRRTSWASRSRSSTSRPTCAAACTRPSSPRLPSPHCRQTISARGRATRARPPR